VTVSDSRRKSLKRLRFRAVPAMAADLRHGPQNFLTKIRADFYIGPRKLRPVPLLQLGTEGHLRGRREHG